MCSVFVWEKCIPGVFDPPLLQDKLPSETLERNLHKMGVFTFRLRDGDTVDDFMCLCKFPSDTTGDPTACCLDSASMLDMRVKNRDTRIVVYVHGNAECVHTSVPAQEFVTTTLHKIYVTFEWRGYQSRSQSCPTFESQCVRLLAVLRFLSGTSDDQSLSIALLGFSLGCAVLLRSVQLARLPALRPSVANDVRIERVRFVCLLAPFLSGPAVLLKNTILEDALVHVFPPMNNAAAVGALQIPMLAIHGTEDGVIPTHHSEKLSQYFEASTYNRRYRSRYVYVDGATHSTLLCAPHVAVVTDAIIQFESECERNAA
ncbi:hypothetical protein CYMTET_2833 [Cymbomonas tetramitiformis]|uniref:Serine hydrolase domain-containing protein n=1 Tax=Cymbomonas tetramitiformis TaxID=36881 RepID=A0AAE0H479_9CHLO|nr:hypothetical protein CYMTET_2833 [Cymbomonas tetramitiformis]